MPDRADPHADADRIPPRPNPAAAGLALLGRLAVLSGLAGAVWTLARHIQLRIDAAADAPLWLLTSIASMLGGMLVGFLLLGAARMVELAERRDTQRRALISALRRTGDPARGSPAASLRSTAPPADETSTRRLEAG